MSPYRIIGCDSTDTYYVFSAKYVSGDIDNARIIQIVRRIDSISEKNLLSTKEIANERITSTNYNVLATYCVYKNSPYVKHSTYRIEFVRYQHATGITITSVVSDSEIKLSDCLRTAIEHYCKLKSIRIHEVI